jgi:hypothetical protein
MPGIAWRAVNQTYTESTGIIVPRQEKLMIVGGEVFIDNFIVKTQTGQRGGLNAKVTQFEMKARALANEFDRAFFEGDDLVDTNELVGLRRRLTGNQVLLQAAGGGALTLAKLNELLDAVPFPNKHLFMNRTLRRKVTDLLNAVSGSAYISWDQGTFGRQTMRYAEVPIHIIEETGTGSTLLDFNEDPGDATADTASIYCVSFGTDRVHGIRNGSNRVVDVEDFGEIQAKPGHLGRIEAYYGMAIRHPRAAARLRGITNA